MAAPTKGNITQNSATPGANFRSINHTQNTGNNRFLILFLTMSNGKSYTGATYGGNAMEFEYTIERGGLSSRMAVFTLVDPPTGSNALRVNFNNTVYTPLSFYAQSFTDCGGFGAEVKTGGGPNPRTGNITVEQDSLIMVTSTSNGVNQTVQIPTGTNVTRTNHNINKRVAVGAISATGHDAGAISVTATTNNVNLTLDRVEIKGLSSSGGGENNFFMIM